MSYAITVLVNMEQQLISALKAGYSKPETYEANQQSLREVQQALGILKGRSEFVFTDLPLVGVDYDEWKPETYRGIVVEIGEQKIRFNSGNFDADSLEVCKKFPAFMERSSVSHYVSDRKKVEQSGKGL